VSLQGSIVRLQGQVSIQDFKVTLQYFPSEHSIQQCFSAQTRTGMGHLRKPPGVELIPAVD
jgi:hypothetical protein